MTDFPSDIPLPLFVHTWARWGVETQRMGAAAALASITWPVANTAFYVPVWLPWTYPVRRVFWINGTSVTSTNMDFGIYSADGERIYSTGSTAASGTSATQYVDVTDFTLGPGRYYFALADSSGTANRGGQGSTAFTVARVRMSGVLQEASALPLPASMTPSAVANSCTPACGITRTASGF